MPVIDLTDPQWIMAVTAVAVALSGLLLWLWRAVAGWSRMRNRAAAAQVADLRAHFEAVGNRPFLIITNHGSLTAESIEVDLDGKPITQHGLFGAYARGNPLPTLAPGATHRYRGIEVDYGSGHVFGVHIRWTTDRGKRGEFVQAIPRP